MSPQQPPIVYENVQLPNIADSVVNLVCPTDGTMLSERYNIKDDRYECPTCDRVSCQEVLRR
jgi:hypothetical protein